MAAASDRTPTYLSSRSADVILSDVRPTKLKGEALRSINVFLDELLWLILSTARSFSTERLKSGLLKILPTPLGKEALLEAEVELRAYWERTNLTNPSIPRSSSDDSTQDFPLQPAFELLRLKCEAYSTLNDADEDAETEARWQAKMTQTGSFSASKAASVAPAALYLTAILEAVCEHIISNTGRVTARDSSRTAATLQDFFIALCEDDTIYALFKTMKVHDQIENQTKASRPRRSKSFSRNETGSPARAVSPPSDVHATNDAPNPPPRSKSRLSSDSAASGPYNGSGGGVPPSSSRSSLDKSKAKRMFRRTSGDREVPANGQGDTPNNHKRSGSGLSDATKRAWTSFDDSTKLDPADLEDDSLVQEFDDLMRSGSTMKVSLTPDRLKTFEVYNKEKNLRANKVPPSSATSAIRSAAVAKGIYDSSTDNSASDDAVVETFRNGLAASAPPPHLRRVDSIVETEEEDTSMPTPLLGRPRHESLSKVTAPATFQKQHPLVQSRSRSISASASQGPPQNHVGRKSSFTGGGISSQHTTRPEKAVRHIPKQLDTGSGMPKTKRTAMPNRESIDLDDIMNGASEEEHVTKPPFTPKSAARPVEPSTRDLISFLNDGPPDLPSFSTSVTATSPDPKAKTGRFRSMVSRLTRGGSSEKLVSQGFSDETFSPMRKNSAPHLPPPPVMPHSLSAKKSLRNISASSLQAIQPRPSPISPPPSPSVEGPLSSPARSRQPSTPRKTAPAWETKGDADAPPIPGAARHNGTPSPSRTPPVKASQSELKVQPAISRDLAPAVTQKSIPPSPTVPEKDTPPIREQQAPSSKTDRHNAYTPPPRTVSQPLPSYAKDLRRLMSKATTADECRLLLDMLLAQSGVHVDTSEPVAPSSLDGLTEHHQSSLVEVLLSNGELSQGRVVDGTI